jgi:PAS domain S-box-containing protein
MAALRRKEMIYKALVWLVVMSVGWLVAETLVFFTMREHIRDIMLFHLSSVLVVVSTFSALYWVDQTLKRHRTAQSHTALHQVQQELNKSVRRYRCLLEGAGNAIFIFDAVSGRLQEVNRKGTELLGFSKEELEQLQGRDLVVDEDQEAFLSLVRRVVRRGRGRADAITFLRKSGERFIAEVEARHIDLGDERVVHAIVRNITFKQRAEREIRQRNRELTILNTIIAHANETLKLDSTLTVILQEMLAAFATDAGSIHLLEEVGYPPKLAASEGLSALACQELAGHRCPCATTRLCHEKAGIGIPDCSMGQVAAAEGWGGVIGIPLFLRKRLVGVMHLLGRGDRHYNAEELQFFITLGNQIGIVVEHVRIFSELHWKNEELLRSHRLLEKRSHQLSISQNRLKANLAQVEQANLEMARLDKTKNHFLGMISHEFKTPLTGIMGSSELLLASLDVSRTQDRHLIEMIHTGGKRLNEIVNDLLKVARIENRSLAINRVPLHLAELFGDVMEQLASLIVERRQQIVLGDLWHLPHFHGDREYLQEVFSELLENAAKFTRDGGSIILNARVADRLTLQGKAPLLERFNAGFYANMGDRTYFEVEVRDTGIGIAVDEQIAIFDKFYEAGDIRHHFSSKHQFMGKGAGLGLTIVKGMVEAHGGMVWVESTGKSSQGDPGSSFYVLLPIEEGSGLTIDHSLGEQLPLVITNSGE